MCPKIDEIVSGKVMFPFMVKLSSVGITTSIAKEVSHNKHEDHSACLLIAKDICDQICENVPLSQTKFYPLCWTFKLYNK